MKDTFDRGRNRVQTDILQAWFPFVAVSDIAFFCIIREDAKLRPKRPNSAQPKQRHPCSAQASLESDFLCTFGVSDVSKIDWVGPACSAHENTQLRLKVRMST